MINIRAISCSAECLLLVCQKLQEDLDLYLRSPPATLRMVRAGCHFSQFSQKVEYFASTFFLTLVAWPRSSALRSLPATSLSHIPSRAILSEMMRIRRKIQSMRWSKIISNQDRTSLLDMGLACDSRCYISKSNFASQIVHRKPLSWVESARPESIFASSGVLQQHHLRKSRIRSLPKSSWNVYLGWLRGVAARAEITLLSTLFYI